MKSLFEYNIVLRNRNEKGWPGGDKVALEGFKAALKSMSLKVVSKPGNSPAIILGWNINYLWTLRHLIEAKYRGDYFAVFALHINVNSIIFQKLVAEYADGLFFVSKKEQESFEKYVGLEVGKKAHICGIGVNELFKTDKLNNKHGVICVGRIERRKNQLRLIHACLDLKLPLTLVGSVADEEYYNECKVAAGGSKAITFVEYIDDEGLKRLYEKSKVVAHVATFEPWGLTIREGALANCNIVMTNQTFTEEALPSMWWCDPETTDDIKKQLMLAHEAECTIKNQKYVLEHFKWELQSKNLAKGLEVIINSKPKQVDEYFWKEAALMMAQQHAADEETLLTVNKTVQELDVENRRKQKAIEELRLLMANTKRYALERYATHRLLKKLFR